MKICIIPLNLSLKRVHPEGEKLENHGFILNGLTVNGLLRFIVSLSNYSLAMTTQWQPERNFLIIHLRPPIFC